MIRNIKKYFQRMEGYENVKTPRNIDASFVLCLDDHVIGYLSLHEGTWTFKYSDYFKEQDELSPIPDFPVASKEYSSEELWPFFMLRMPGAEQTRVQEVLGSEAAAEVSSLEMLRLFGEVTIADPYRLVRAT